MADAIKNRVEAERKAQSWYVFLRNNRLSEEQGAQIASSYSLLANFIKTNNLQSDTGELLNAKEIAHLLTIQPTQQEAHTEEKPQENATAVSDGIGDVTGAAIATAASVFIKPEIMEEDPRYQHLEHNLKKDWLKTHKAKDFNSKEGIEFLYGSLSDPKKETLEHEAALSFRVKHAKQAAKYDKKKEKIHKNLTYDPALSYTNYKIEEYQNALVELANQPLYKLKAKDREKLSEENVKALQNAHLQTLGFTENIDELNKKIEDQGHAAFVKNHPEKAKAYTSDEQTNKLKTADELLLQQKLKIAQAVVQNNTQELAGLSDKDILDAHKAHAHVNGMTKEEQEAFAKQKLTTIRSSQTPKSIAGNWENKMKAALAEKKKNEQEKTTGKQKKQKEQPQKELLNVDQANQLFRSFQKKFIPVSATKGGTGSGTAATQKPNIPVSGKSGGTGPGRAATNKGANPARRAGTKLAQKGGQALTRLLASPAGLYIIAIVGIILLIILLVIIIVMIASGAGGSYDDQGASDKIPPTKGLFIHLEGPITNHVANNENISYKAYVAYSETKIIYLTDILPPNTSFVSATANITGKYVTKTDSTNKITSVVWALPGPLNDIAPSGTPQTKPPTFTIVLHPDKDDIIVRNKITSSLQPDSSASPSGGGNLPPNNDTCSGKYILNNPKGNYGDPACDFKKDDLYALLKQQDPLYADKWFLKIVPCESGYNPNAYLAASASGKGAYGLFQMNPTGQGNGKYDAGDVYWQQQAINAPMYNHLIADSFGYWACNR